MGNNESNHHLYFITDRDVDVISEQTGLRKEHLIYLRDEYKVNF